MMIAERVRAYLDYLDPGNRRYLEALRREAEEGEVPVIRRDSERFLRSLLAGLRPERVLELGTAVGYSALVMAEELPPSAHITTVENYAPRIARAKENIGRYGAGRITLIEGDAYELLKEQPDEAYDFVFLDAAKGQYLKWLPELLRVLSPGGTLLSDNVLQGGDTAESRFAIDRRDRTIHSRMRSYLEALSAREGLRTSILPIGDGLAFSVKEKRIEQREA
jgi:O-methyltransferase family protein